MIIWLASYPKSGNTYVRAFLSAYYYSKDGKFDFNQISNIRQFPDKEFLNEKTESVLEASKQWMPSQRKIIANKKIKFLKTHNCLGNYKGNTFTSNETSLGAIYIVRDPRNVFTSVKNHFSYDDEKALQMILDKKSTLMSKGYETFSYISSWANNYLSWLRYNNFRRLFVKYEDLLENKYETFRDIIVFSNTLMNRSEGIDKFGNYTFGIKEHIIFPEVNFDRVDKIRGLDITIVINSRDKKHSHELLNKLNFPFIKKGDN